MSDLQPHHHVLRRVCIERHLNLADDHALVNRLIASGCVSEKLLHSDAYVSKDVQRKYFAWFQNQPYELFLKFMECLRGDEKYSKLVRMLDRALAEHVDPRSVNEYSNVTARMSHHSVSTHSAVGHSISNSSNKLPLTTGNLV